LAQFTCIRINSEKKEWGLVLSKGDVNRISGSGLPRADIGSPAYRLSDGNAKVAESKRDLWIESKGEEKESEKEESCSIWYTNHPLHNIPSFILYLHS
jgi:hypothetical protein